MLKHLSLPRIADALQPVGHPATGFASTGVDTPLPSESGCGNSVLVSLQSAWQLFVYMAR